METILLIGRDVPLLQIREVLLKRTAGQIISRQPAELEELSQQTIKLVVLCHTLGAAEREAMIGVVRDRWQAKILQLQSGLNNAPTDGADAVVSTDPKAFLTQVQAMLAAE